MPLIKRSYLNAVGLCLLVGPVAVWLGLKFRTKPLAPPAPPAASSPHINGVPGATTPSGHRIWYAQDSLPKLTLPNSQTQTIRSILNIRHSMRFGSYVWDDVGIPAGPAWVRVDLGTQMLSVFRSGHEIGSAVILYGADSVPTPTGAFKIIQKVEHYHSRTYDAPMPFTLRLTQDWVAIHASNVRDGYATHGCVGIPIDFAKRLFAQMRVGDQVVILPEKNINHKK